MAREWIRNPAPPLTRPADPPPRRRRPAVPSAAAVEGVTG
eukprot:gene47104-28590_t